MIRAYEDGKLIIKTLVIGIFVLIVLGYGIYQSQNILKGPRVTVEYPLDGSTVTEDLIAIKGRTKNISSITLNDRSIYIDETGLFKEKLMLYPGYNIIKIRAEDKFGSMVEEYVEVIHSKS